LVSSGCAPSVDPLFGGHLNLLLWPQRAGGLPHFVVETSLCFSAPGDAF
jgi:hypothetical protein